MTIISISFLLQVLGVTIALIGAAYAYVKLIAYNYWSSKGVAQAEPVAPFGSLWPVFTTKKSMGELMRDGYFRFKKNRIFGLYTFHKPMLVICDPDIIRFVLTKEFSNFQNRLAYQNEKADPLSNHLFMLHGEKWKKLRTKLSPTFSSGKLKHMFETVKETADVLSQCLEDETKKTKLISMKSLMARFTTDVIASIAFGIDCNSLRNSNAEFYRWGQKIFETKPVKNTLQVLFPSVLPLFNISVTDRGAAQFFIKVFTDVVRYRKANNLVRKDFLELIVKLMDEGHVEGDDGHEPLPKSEDAKEKLTMLEGAAQAFVFWIAGFEPASTTSTHCLYEMALNQEIQDKVVDEMNKVLEESGGLTYESIAKMHYLHKVISETLRKYPSFPTINRQCTQDVELLDTGLKVSKGTPVIVPVLGLHWDPEIFPEPEKFDPERFNQENIAGRDHHVYLPFGEGPRNCIGMRLGLLQTKIALVTVLSKYRISPGPDTKVPLPLDRGSFLHMPNDKVILKLERR